MDSKMTLHAEPTAAEVSSALWTYLPAAIANRRRAWMIFLVAAALMCVLAFIGAWQIWVPAIAVTGLVVYLAVQSQKRQFASSIVKSGLADPCTVTADARGLRVQTDRSDLRFDWSNYQDVIETPEGVGLVAGGGTTLRWIPTRAFASPDERRRFVQLATAVD